MATVDIGLRLLLQDLASGGLSSFQGILRDLIAFAASGAMGMEDFTGAISKQEAAIVRSEEKIQAYNDALKTLELQSAAAQAELEATRIAVEDIGNISTQGKIDALSLEMQGYETELFKTQTQLDNTTAAMGRMQALGLDTTAEEAAIERYTLKIETLKAQIADLNAEMQALTDQGLLQNEEALLKAEARAQSYKQKIDDLNASILDENINILASNRRLQELADAQDTAAAKADTLKVSLGLLAGGAIGLGIFGTTMKTLAQDGSDLQDAMTNLGIAFNLTDQQAAQMQNTLTNVASNSKFTTSEVADGFTALGEKGATVADVIDKGLGQSMVNFAESVKSGTVPAANLLSASLQIFNADASQANYYASLLTYAFYNGIPSVDQLGQVLQDAGGKAASLGIPLDQLLTTMTYLTKSGLSASTASDSLRYMLDALTSPTAKASDELSYLGLVTINNATPAFKGFEAQLNHTLGTLKGGAPQFDGTLTSLQQMYQAAEKIPGLRTDQTFMQWATSMGIVSNKLYDAHGNMLPLFDILMKIGGAINKMPDPEQKAQAINALFNVRSGKDANVLFNNLDKLKKYLDETDAQMKKFAGGGGVNKDAQKQDATMSGRWSELTTTIKSMLGQLGTPLTTFFAGLFHNFNQLISTLDTTNPQLQKFVAIMLVVGLALSGIALVGGLIALAFTGIGAVVLGFLGPIFLVVLGILILTPLIAALALAFGNFIKSSDPTAVFLRGIGKAIGDTAKDVAGLAGDWWKMLNGVSDPKLGNSFQQLGKALLDLWNTVKPVVGFLLVLIGSVLVGVISGAVVGLVSFISGLASLISGVVSIVSGYINIFSGFLKLLWDLAHGNLAGVQADWNQMLTGMWQIAGGIWQLIQGLFKASVGSILGFINGFVTGVVQFFQHLADVLVNHSIIPDMLKSILSWFQNIGGQVLGWLGGWINNIIGFFGNLATRVFTAAMDVWNNVTRVFQWGVSVAVSQVQGLPNMILSAIGNLGTIMWNSGMNMMQMFGSAITSGGGYVWNAVTGVANQIKHFLGFASPPKGGPLADSDTYMPAMMQMYGAGILKNQHHITGAVMTVARGMNPTQFLTPGTMQAYSAFSSAGSTGGASTTVNLNMDGKQIGQVVIDRVSGQLVMNGVNRALR